LDNTIFLSSQKILLDSTAPDFSLNKGSPDYQLKGTQDSLDLFGESFNKYSLPTVIRALNTQQ
jgi:hypothetical protein